MNFWEKGLIHPIDGWSQSSGSPRVFSGSAVAAGNLLKMKILIESGAETLGKRAL